ncbi:MAG: chorismate mutase [Syntrophobacteraceae bacterium]
MDEELDKIRQEIDGIDSEVLRLLNRRMELAIEVGRIKAARSLPFFHPEREQIIYQRLSKLNPGPLSEESLRSIYREVFAASRLIQYGSDNTNAQWGKHSSWVRKTGICGCLVESSSEEFPKWLNNPEVDLVEWRMDKFANRYSTEEMKSFLSALSIKHRLPVIATNRPVREMGVFAGREDLRLSMLEEAARSGADWIDLEHDTDADNIARFRQAGAKVLLSWHCPAETPSRGILRAKLESMRKTGADALKIVTMAQSGEDNLRVLELIPLAGKEFGIDLIAFCMGPAGKWSRLVSIFLGSPWTYAQFAGQSAGAPGQLPDSEMRALIHCIDLLNP